MNVTNQILEKFKAKKKKELGKLLSYSAFLCIAIAVLVLCFLYLNPHSYSDTNLTIIIFGSIEMIFFGMFSIIRNWKTLTKDSIQTYIDEILVNTNCNQLKMLIYDLAISSSFLSLTSLMISIFSFGLSLLTLGVTVFLKGYEKLNYEKIFEILTIPITIFVVLMYCVLGFAIFLGNQVTKRQLRILIKNYLYERQKMDDEVN